MKKDSDVDKNKLITRKNNNHKHFARNKLFENKY